MGTAGAVRPAVVATPSGQGKGGPTDLAPQDQDDDHTDDDEEQDD